MNFVDTHCHIHDVDYPLAPAEVLERARAANITRMVCVGTNQQSSADALAFAAATPECYASIGVHPHHTNTGYGRIAELAAGHPKKLVAVGEIGLDYYYKHSPRDIQIPALESQIQTALNYNLPIIFHVREAFDDFWPIFDNFHGLRGVLHSFTDTTANLEKGLERGLYVGLNGISTFTKNYQQIETFTQVPLSRMLLETDAPFLTPAPKRGTINEPAFVGYVAQYHAAQRGIRLEELAAITTANANALFAL